MTPSRLLVFLLTISLVAIVITKAQSKRKFTYVGIDRCKICHTADAIGNQHNNWLSSPHSKAFSTLKGKKALKIAKKFGIAVPWNNLKCLKCHTTGKGRYKITKTEGVGCEACHGPGSKYSEMENHVNYRNKKSGYNRAKKYGMFPILDYENNLKKRESLCLYCHRKTRPCYPTSRKGIQKQIITIQVIDKLIKGNQNFLHQLRR
jgi:hypothetical protein